MMRASSPSHFTRQAWVWMAGAVVALGLLGCSESFDPISKLNTLRVLAVRADNPYPHPGDTVHLDMLWYDGKSPPDQQPTLRPPPIGMPTLPKAGESRQLRLFWLSGCFDPDGDLYYECFPQFAQELASAQTDPASLANVAGFGSSFDVSVPADIITRRPPKEGQTPYGLSYVFFALCAGEVMPVEPGPDGLPLACMDAAGNRLGQDDFVIGYFAFYSYDQITNTNPKIDGLLVDGSPVAEGDEPSFPVGGEVAVKVQVDPASVEINPLSLDAKGNPQTEMMWVDYFASSGDLDKAARLVNDATTGFNDDNGVKLTLPGAPQTVELFAVVHDSRGGVQWIQRAVQAK